LTTASRVIEFAGGATFGDRVSIIALLWNRGRCVTIIIMLFTRWDLLFFRRLEVVFPDHTPLEQIYVRDAITRFGDMAQITDTTLFRDACATAKLSVKIALKIFPVADADAMLKDVCFEAMTERARCTPGVRQADVVPLMLVAMCIKGVFVSIKLPNPEGGVWSISTKANLNALIPMYVRSTNIIICRCFGSVEEACAICYPHANPEIIRRFDNNFFEIMIGGRSVIMFFHQ
jgi:hypothetical protein